MATDSTPAKVRISDGLGPDAEARECQHCHGKGWNDVWRAVTGHYAGREEFREECEHCEGAGKLKEELQA